MCVDVMPVLRYDKVIMYILLLLVLILMQLTARPYRYICASVHLHGCVNIPHLSAFYLHSFVLST